MASQRFCLRWNNHQTNMLSVFDQLLHAETFTDVTLAVEGQYLKAHKMVLSACSPYFQQIFVNHPEKHPIVILKDVPFKDMKCLLDFMYRGEVSVDQDRLAAFLRVAESLRIKGLTEVNDDKPPLPTASLTSSGVSTSQTTTNPSQQQLQQQLAAAASRNTQLAATLQHSHQLRSKSGGGGGQGGQSMLLTNPLLGSALSQQKRKRGRPRKLSGSDTGEGEYDGYESEGVAQGSSPDLMEVKMATDGTSNSGDENVISRSEEHDDDPEDAMEISVSPPATSANNNSSKNARSSSPASSGTAAANATAATNSNSTNNNNTTSNSATTPTTTNNSSANNAAAAKSSASSLRNENSMSALADKPEITIIPQYPKAAAAPPAPTEPSAKTAQVIPMDADETHDLNEDDDDDDENSVEDGEEDSESDLEFILPKYETSDECTIVESKNPPPPQAPSQDGQSSHQMQPNTKQQQQLFLHQLQQQHLQNLAKMRLIHGGRNGTENGDSNGAIAIGSDPEDLDLGSPETSMSLEPNGNGHHHYNPSSKQPAQRRRARRKNLSPDDQAESLTEMSVRGLNLFRYASISDGVYQCMECAKENVQKTFKNKYSFQRHAFLYHEGAQRKVFPCPVCNKEFSRPDKMKNHLKTTHESYMAKADPVYPMGFIEQAPQQGQGQIPPPTTKIESVLNAIQLQQHLNMQKELRSQQAKFQQMHQQMISSPKLVDNGSSQ